MPIWITWLLARPAWILCIALGACVGVQTVRIHSLQSDVREAEANTAILKSTIATERLTFEQQAREQERRQSEALVGVAAVYEQEKKDVQANAARVAAGLRDGSIRMRDEWAGCETARMSADAATAGKLAEQDRLRRESLQRVLGWVGELQAERNQCVDGWSGVAAAARVMQGAEQ